MIGSGVFKNKASTTSAAGAEVRDSYDNAAILPQVSAAGKGGASRRGQSAGLSLSSAQILNELE